MGFCKLTMQKPSIMSLKAGLRNQMLVCCPVSVVLLAVITGAECSRVKAVTKCLLHAMSSCDSDEILGPRRTLCLSFPCMWRSPNVITTVT